MAAKVVIKKEMGFFFYKAVLVADITYNKKYSSHSEVVATCFTLVIKTHFTFV